MTWKDEVEEEGKGARWRRVGWRKRVVWRGAGHGREAINEGVNEHCGGGRLGEVWLKGAGYGRE